MLTKLHVSQITIAYQHDVGGYYEFTICKDNVNFVEKRNDSK